MKKIILILALILLIPFAASAQYLDSAKDPKGFIEYPWGTPLTQITRDEHLVFVDSKPHQNNQIKVYKLPLEEGNSLQITFVFFEDQLVSGVLMVGPEHKASLMELTQKEFGPYSYESEDGTYYWEFPDTQIIALTHSNAFTISFGEQKFYKSQ